MGKNKIFFKKLSSAADVLSQNRSSTLLFSRYGNFYMPSIKVHEAIRTAYIIKITKKSTQRYLYLTYKGKKIVISFIEN